MEVKSKHSLSGKEIKENKFLDKTPLLPAGSRNRRGGGDGSFLQRGDLGKAEHGIRPSDIRT